MNSDFLEILKQSNGNEEYFKKLITQNKNIINKEFKIIKDSQEYIYSPLTYCLEQKLSELSIILIEQGANVNMKGEKGNIALHLAVMAQNLEIVKLLKQYNADATIKNKSQNTPLKIVDPAMADNGVLYKGFDNNIIKGMKSLCSDADIIIPNLTEACFITDYEYKEKYNEEYIMTLIEKLKTFGTKIIILTGIGYDDDTTGVVVAEKGEVKYYKHRKISKNFHGTGDIYSAVFIGAYLSGKNAFDSAKAAADYVLECIEYTMKNPSHWYGVMFEPLLADFISRIKGN
jgi:hydroxymethylpyrimidine/phosphomethylpyrimidine kinase